MGRYFILQIIALCITILCEAQTIRFNILKSNFSEAEIRRELSFYPSALINTYLKEIIVDGGSGYCGRAEVFSNRIILNGQCNQCGTLREVIHHEISSLILHLYDGNGKPTYDAPALDSLYGAFLSLNGDYKYSYANDIFINQLIDPALSDRFYILKYASRDFENDFNIIAQFLFRDGQQTIDFIESYPDKPVSKKISLVITFYNRINPLFTKEFFRSQL